MHVLMKNFFYCSHLPLSTIIRLNFMPGQQNISRTFCDNKRNLHFIASRLSNLIIQSSIRRGKNTKHSNSNSSWRIFPNSCGKSHNNRDRWKDLRGFFCEWRDFNWKIKKKILSLLIKITTAAARFIDTAFFVVVCSSHFVTLQKKKYTKIFFCLFHKNLYSNSENSFYWKPQ